MLIKRKRWLLVATLFVLGPLVGMVLGVFGGLQLSSWFGCDATDAVENPAKIESAHTGDADAAVRNAEVVLPGGEEVAFGELAPGRATAVVVMKDINCPVCQRQLRVLSEQMDEIQQRGGTVVGLTDASSCENRRLMDRYDLNFPVVSDDDHQVLRHFDMTLPQRSYVMPGVIFMDEDGAVEHVERGRRPGERQEGMIIRRITHR